ncbi:hypothetical protein EVAR_41311_1 [Eumeta japonica]|uniref:Uncharacterized protein n=1 Tax=Eumeta variegata TaxID=151549 RepID=A0A4C1X0Y9_EUMVA|nr:hypothetical protein EVAR_41311_1 [Eumeta japonica]
MIAMAPNTCSARAKVSAKAQSNIELPPRRLGSRIQRSGRGGYIEKTGGGAREGSGRMLSSIGAARPLAARLARARRERARSRAAAFGPPARGRARRLRGAVAARRRPRRDVLLQCERLRVTPPLISIPRGLNGSALKARTPAQRGPGLPTALVTVATVTSGTDGLTCEPRSKWFNMT